MQLITVTYASSPSSDLLISTHEPNFKSDDSICLGLGSIDAGTVTAFVIVGLTGCGYMTDYN